MKKWSFLLASAVLSFQLSASEVDFVQVSGSGAVSVTPSQARLTLVFSAQNADVAVGKQQVDAQSAAFAEVLRKHKINDKDVNNAPLVVYPEQREQKLDQFRIERSTTVLIRDLNQYPQLLEAAARLKVAQIHPVELQTENSEQHYKDALEQAFAAAKAKAQQLASLSGRKLGNVKQVYEQSSAPGPRFKGMMMAAEAMPVSFGQQQIRADLQVQFELTNR